ncbi:hypothetical protein SKAU_G00191350 [Synaphobranchus kaupii]|uniref:Uncharacterized protein n=1 Tax=Synaphobranchus kaupii TaxID=118154 RepID=A0A9Q1FDL7_SYNKA|nr:hypothetical protein SKAU_G00191350 [Synaphobranchus kaupii]
MQPSITVFRIKLVCFSGRIASSWQSLPITALHHLRCRQSVAGSRLLLPTACVDLKQESWPGALETVSSMCAIQTSALREGRSPSSTLQPQALNGGSDCLECELS